jgi:putative IMPACT (imprinted ancient) family translation regulator
MTDTDAELARAYIKGQKVIDAFDRRDANAQSRCFALVHELERRKVKRLQQASEPASEVGVGELQEAAE